MRGEQHRCDEYCVCPVHRTPMIYWPQGDEHACQDVTCEYGHGFERAQAGIEYRRAERLVKEYRELAAPVVAGLSTDEHHRVMRGGLPFCQCGHSLAGGKATEALITHLLQVLATERRQPRMTRGGLALSQQSGQQDERRHGENESRRPVLPPRAPLAGDLLPAHGSDFLVCAEGPACPPAQRRADPEEHHGGGDHRTAPSPS